MKIRLLLLFFFLSILFPRQLFAHEAGEEPFFTINGKVAMEHPVTSSGISATSFTIPQDIVTEIYLVNQPILFAINAEKLIKQFNGKAMGTIQYQWDFGDGTVAEGLENTHTYKEKGSYILKIFATELGEKRKPQLIQSVQLNILSSDADTLLSPSIQVKNSTPISEGVFSADFRIPIQLEAIVDDVSSVRQYLWEFSDGTTAQGQRISHKENLNKDQAIILLHITDKNNIIYDKAVVLANEVEAQSTTIPGYYTGVIILSIQVIIIAIIAAWFIYDLLRRKKK